MYFWCQQSLSVPDTREELVESIWPGQWSNRSGHIFVNNTNDVNIYNTQHANFLAYYTWKEMGVIYIIHKWCKCRKCKWTHCIQKSIKVSIINIDIISIVYKIWPDLLHHWPGQTLSTSSLSCFIFWANGLQCKCYVFVVITTFFKLFNRTVIETKR